MKSPALYRILEKTPLGSLAALSVGAFLRADKAELERIYGVLPSHRRESRNEFFIQHHAMTENILLWAVEYWKTVAIINSSLAVSAVPGIDEKESKAASFLLNAHKAKQATLIEAMRQICADAGIDFQDVATFAEVDTNIDARPIPKLIPEYVEMFGIASNKIF
jgi:hypothetical protein